MEFEFTVKLSVPLIDPDQLIERLGAAGCTDAAVGVGQPGRMALSFTRDAKSAKQAIIGALEEARAAIPKARLLEITPDLVGLSDIADLVSVTRQNMRKLMLKYPDSFPVAVHEGTSSLWHLFPVLKWLQERAHYAVSQTLLEVSHIAMQINLARDSCQIEPSVHRAVRELVT